MDLGGFDLNVWRPRFETAYKMMWPTQNILELLKTGAFCFFFLVWIFGQVSHTYTLLSMSESSQTKNEWPAEVPL